MTAQKAPTGLSAPGRRLWRSVTSDFDLDQHELVVLIEACRTADTCARLDALIARDGDSLESPQGTRVHPALAEVRQQRITMTRLIAALRIPEDEQHHADAAAEKRSQRRAGARGVYAIGDAS